MFPSFPGPRPGVSPNFPRGFRHPRPQQQAWNVPPQMRPRAAMPAPRPNRLPLGGMPRSQSPGGAAFRAEPPNRRQNAEYAPPQPLPQTTRPAPTPAKLTFRAQNDDESTNVDAASATLSLPAPEKLGIAPPQSAAPVQVATAKVDWNEVHGELRRLGAVGFDLRTLPDGSRRAMLTLPAGQSGKCRLIEATATTEAAAVAAALSRAQELDVR